MKKFGAMIKNYIKTAYRSLKKSKGFTAINVLGLSVGLATCLLIVLYVADELSYDKYNKNAANIYRITENVKLNGNEGSYAGTEKPLLFAIKDFPEIEKSTKIISKNNLFITPSKFNMKKGVSNIVEKNVAFAESDLFDVFTLPMTEGNPATSLSAPHSAVITESMAKKYFSTIKAVGKTLTINDTSFYKVTGVIKDIPAQSHFNYDFILSFNSIPEYQVDSWGYSGVHNYLLLKPGTDIHKLEAKIRSIALKHSSASMVQGGNYLNYELTPLPDIHLRSHSQYELSQGGNIKYVYIFLLIAVFILLIACVNFMNLSTARSSGRAREVGVRKVLGSARKYLIAQFLTESMLVTLIAFVIAIVLAFMAIPLFNEVAAKHLSLGFNTFAWLLPALVIALLIGLLAGFYPAFFLSSFKPIEVLKGKLATGFKGGYLRSFLVVFQFSISIFLIIGTIVIYNQLNYIHNKSLGFDRSQVMVIKNVNVLGNQAAIFKQEVKQMPGVVNATMSSYLPTGEERNITGMFPQLPLDIKQDVLSEFWPVDEDYLSTMGIKLVAGRNFSRAMATDSSGLIVNEAFVKRFGFKDPLNKPIYRNSIGLQTFHIIGVMKNFNFSSLKEEIKPLALIYDESRGAISARVKVADIGSFINTVKNKWKGFSPNQEFSYSFMDQDFDATYRSEERIGELFIAFSTLAIFIACLGLFGLAAYAAEQRNKEIGIRKVLGASISGIVALLSTEFIKLVFIAILIASPLAWYAMNKWLQDFAYRINIQWWVIALAGVVAVLIAFVTISFQSVKAALANPVDSLKSGE